MPRRPSPDSLKSYSLKAVAKHLEILSYGCEKGSPELRDLIDTEYFLQIQGDLKGDSFKAILHSNQLEIVFLNTYNQFLSFDTILGPLYDYPGSVLSDLSDTVHNKRAGSKHLLHLIIQPNISRYIIGIAGSLNSTMRLLRERCAKSLKSIVLK